MFDISKIAENIKKSFTNVGSADFSIESVQDYMQNHKKQMIIVCFALVLLMVLFFMMAVKSNSTGKKEKMLFTVTPVDDALILPTDPGITEDFQFYREKRSAWSKEDAEKWFTVPDDTMIEDLENTNTKIISDILEAAP